MIDSGYGFMDNAVNCSNNPGMSMERVGFWLKEIRAPFLSLSVVLIFLGTAVAAAEGPIRISRALLALVGLVLLHISVNVLNEYSDYESGIDFNTEPTPFSGGSGMLTAGKITPAAAYAMGVGCLALGTVIGLYFLWVTNVWLLPLLMVGGFAVYAYTTLLAKHAMGEIFAGLGLGLLPILGASFVQTEHYSTGALAAAIPAGMLTFNLLLINEFPDIDADMRGGRKNLLIALGSGPAGKIYGVTMMGMYAWIVIAVVLGLIPMFGLAALLTLPIALKPILWAWHLPPGRDLLIGALGANVITNLGTQVLLGAGFLAAVYW